MKLITQIKIYLRLLKNFNKVGKIKSLYFFIYSMPLIGFCFFIFAKIILLTRSKKIIVFFLKRKIFLSIIRFLDIETKVFISTLLPNYNQKIKSIEENSLVNNIKTINLLNDINKDGYASLGKVFSDNECDALINSLKGKKCFNSQVPMQSDGNKYTLNLDVNRYDTLTRAYYCYDPYISLNFDPFKRFINNKDLISLIENYLNFKFTIYSSQTWVNPISKEKHYVHRHHRDYDDYKILGMVVYWTDVDENNGSLSIAKKSHISNYSGEFKNLIGKRGTVHLVDFGSLHKGSPIKDNPRITSFLRFGNYFNHSTVMDCWCTAP